MEIIKSNNWDNFKPFVSVIVPCYNSKGTIRRTIDSIIDQTYKNIELIVVDDGSSDSQKIDDIILEYMNTAPFPILLLKQDNAGVYEARNNGKTLCRGYFELSVDSDDEIVPNAIEIMVNAYESLPEERKSKVAYIASRSALENVDGITNETKFAFPKNINELSQIKARKIGIKVQNKNRKYSKRIAHDLNGLFVVKYWTDIKIDKPDDVKMIFELYLQNLLLSKYEEIFLNDVLYIVHADRSHSITRSKKSVQYLKDITWTFYMMLLDWKNQVGESKIKTFLMFNAFRNCLAKKDSSYKNKYNTPEGFKCLAFILWLPSIFVSRWYYNKRVA